MEGTGKKMLKARAAGIGRRCIISVYMPSGALGFKGTVPRAENLRLNHIIATIRLTSRSKHVVRTVIQIYEGRDCSSPYTVNTLAGEDMNILSRTASVARGGTRQARAKSRHGQCRNERNPEDM